MSWKRRKCQPKPRVKKRSGAANGHKSMGTQEIGYMKVYWLCKRV